MGQDLLEGSQAGEPPARTRRVRLPGWLGGLRRHGRGYAYLPAVVFIAMVLLLLSPSLLGGKILSSGDVVFFQGPFNGEKPASLTSMGNSELFDPVLVFQPDLVTIRRALDSGELGLWNPYQSGGRPLWASQQTAPLFPLTWLAFIRSFWRALAWTAALKLLLAAFGAYMLGRWSGLRRGPSVLCGVSYAFCTYMNSGLQFPLSGVMSMTPWAMLTAGRVARRGRALDTLGLVLAVGLTLLTGSPELIAIALGGVVVYSLYELLANPAGIPADGRPATWRRLALLVGAGVGGLTLSGAALGPFAEFLGVANSTSRGGVGGYPNSIAYSFFFPELWGRPDKAMGQFGPINYTERTAYLGALPILLAVAGVFARRPRGLHLFWALFTGVAVLIAMNTFVHDFVSGLPGPDHVNLLRTLLLVELGERCSRVSAFSAGSTPRDRNASGCCSRWASRSWSRLRSCFVTATPSRTSSAPWDSCRASAAKPSPRRPSSSRSSPGAGSRSAAPASRSWRSRAGSRPRS